MGQTSEDPAELNPQLGVGEAQDLAVDDDHDDNDNEYS